MPKKTISCIINPTAANQKWRRHKKIREYLQKNISGIIHDDLDNKTETIAAAKNLSRENDLLIVAGGDGTIADVIQGIVDAGRGKDTAMAVLPLGSGNAFRKSFGTPLNIRKSLDLIEHGQKKVIDLVNINGHAATFASIGVTARITFEKSKKNIPGFWGHLNAGLSIFKFHPQEYHVELFDGVDDSGNSFDAQSLSLNALDCIIGKTRYFGYNCKIAPHASHDDGLIDITFLEHTPLQVLLALPRIWTGTHHKKIRHFKAKKAIIKGKNLHIQYHGEPLEAVEEVTLEIMPQILTVITP